MTGTVQIVHAIDTEGPLYESLAATFERLREIFAIDNILPSLENLRKLQAGEFDLGDRTRLVQEALSTHRVSTLGSWDQIDRMLADVTSKDYRFRQPDSNGEDGFLIGSVLIMLVLKLIHESVIWGITTYMIDM